MSENNSNIQELETKIAELRKSLNELEGNLEKAREGEQHEAINHLEDYINEVDTKFSSFQIFWKTLLEDLRK
ncbi:hypothetical protein MLD52_06780 [Puniceicoccaceae bacterium K14]|nr:hypothetical protein [Puniceicoccaceae bacterium K14]